MMRYFSFVLWLTLATTAPVLAQGLPHAFSAGTPARADEVNENFRYLAPKNVVFVSPVEGGDASDNGDALRAALLPANLTAINGAPSTTNRYLIQVAPGVYDVGSQSQSLPHFVDVRGSGAGTVIRGSSTSLGVLRGAHGTLSDLTIEVVGTGHTGLYVDSVSTRVSRVSILVNSAPNTNGTGIVTSSATLDLDHVTISVGGSPPTTSVGLHLRDDSRVSANRVDISVTRGQTGLSAGVAVDSGTHFEANALRVHAKGATGGSANVYALTTNANDTIAVVRNSVLEVTGPPTTSFPLKVFSTATTLDVHHSILTNHSGQSFLNAVGASQVRVAASQLAPTANWVGAADVSCVFVYDGGFVERACGSLN